MIACTAHLAQQAGGGTFGPMRNGDATQAVGNQNDRCAVGGNRLGQRLIEPFADLGAPERIQVLAACTATSPWQIAVTTFRLLLDTAGDTALPWHWRTMCLDNAWRPLRDLETQALCACRLKRWQSFAWQLATCELEPSISLTELLQGFHDE